METVLLTAVFSAPEATLLTGKLVLRTLMVVTEVGVDVDLVHGRS